MQKSQGVAFLSVLFLTLVVLMSLGVIVTRTRLGTQFQLQGQHSVAALYAAEAGIAEALACWHEDKTWAPSQYQRPLSNGQASFTIRFSPGESVNNLDGNGPQDSFRGTGTVPPFQALLVVHGESSNRRKTLEVLVGRGGLFPPGCALMSQERLQLFGNVTVTGVRSLSDNREAPADISILNSQDSSNQATWDGLGQLNVSGAFNSNSPNSQAVSSSIAAGNVSQVRNHQNKVPPRNLNVGERVTEALSQSFPNPTLSGPTTTLTAGNYTLISPGTYNGDLVLNDCNLYVSGNFQINGSIRGNGSVFVDGNTELRGSTSISGQDTSGVALYSAGDVTLRGLNGSQFLESFMASAGNDPNGVPYSQHLNNFKHFTDQMLSAVRDGPSASAVLNPGRRRFGNTPGIQDAHPPSDFDCWYAPLVVDLPMANYMGTGISPQHTNPIRKLTRALELDTSPSPTKDFLLKKFQELRPLPTDITNLLAQANHANGTRGLLGTRALVPGTIGEVDLALISPQLEAIRNGSQDGLFDTLNDVLNNTTLVPQAWEREAFYQRAYSTFREMHFDRPGMAYFEGIVYTEGNFEARDELSVVGGLYAVGPHSQVTLRDGVWVTYVPELVAQAGQALGTVHVRQWVRR